MAKGDRELVKMKSSESPHCYYTQKNKRKTTKKLVLRKYDPVVRKHVTYKES